MSANQFLAAFLEEARDILDNLEANLLYLECDPGNPELLAAVFRSMHTIKGSAAMFGLDSVSSFAHGIENILSALRNGEIPFSRAIVEGTLSARDLISEMLASPDGGESLSIRASAIVEEFSNEVGLNRPEKSAAPPDGERPTVKRSYRVSFHLGHDAFRHGMNPGSLLASLAELGETIAVPDCTGVPRLSELDPESACLAWDVFIRAAPGEESIRDVFDGVADISSVEIAPLPDSSEGLDSRRLGEILVERGKLAPDSLQRFFGRQEKNRRSVA